MHRVNQTINENLQTGVIINESQWFENPQQPNNFCKPQTFPRGTHINNWEKDNNKIQLTPSVSQIGFIVQNQPDRNDLDKEFEDENAVEGEIETD